MFMFKLKVITANLRHVVNNNLSKMSQFVIQQYGEGIVARNPQSSYQPGLSENSLKYKVCKIIII